MKILQIIHGYPPTYNAGSEVYTQSICNELKKRHQITVFTREENLYTADYVIRSEKKDDLDFYFVNMAREKDGYNQEKVNQYFAEILESYQPDVAHIGHLNHLSTGLVAELKKQNIPIVFTLHDFWLMCPRGQFLQINFGNKDFYQVCDGQEDKKCAKNCYNRYFSGLKETQEQDLTYWKNWVAARMNATRSLVKDIDLFIAPSQYLKNRFIQDFDIPKDKIVYLDYGFPTHYLNPITKKEKTHFTFGYIGTHIPAKGIDLLIKAFTKVKYPAILKIFGRNRGQGTKALENLAAQCAHKIEFCGEYINQNLAQVVFSNVDCIVVPSIWTENAPLVIHEAQSCHIPVITADVGGMKEYVHHLKNGLLFEHRNQKSLTTQLNFAIENGNLMEELGKRGYIYDETGKVPNIIDHCKSLENIYQQLIERRYETA